MNAPPFRLAVLASGTGTNLQAILDKLHGKDGIEVVAVASDKPGARALDRATDSGIAAEVFPRDGFDSREARDDAMSEWLAQQGVDLVVLAGYMQLLSPGFIDAWRDRVINVHPALLPEFPGLDAIGQALEADVDVTGVTVHYVDEGIDTGPVILQREVPVPPDRDRDALEAAIHATEHELLPDAVRQIAASSRVREVSERVLDVEATEGGSAPAGEPVKVRRALISVSDKTGVVDFARGLSELGVELLSTGGTASAIREAGLEVTDVSVFTGQEEILGGRVKTLHPRLHAALLAKRNSEEHMATLEREGIEPIDLVCVNLYPFSETVARPDVTEEEAVENIDIGGPTMIRAAAKNHRSVAVVVKPESYDAVLAELEGSESAISEETRHWLANEAWAEIALYDAAISRWFGLRYEAFPQHWVFAYEKFLDLSYGENPHQKAALYVESGARSHVLARMAKLHGRSLSFNNVLDLDAAAKLLAEFSEPAAVIVKHNNPCGAAIADDIAEAYEKALACDPLSAFGGVIALNRPVDKALAERLHENFIEVLIAPEYSEDALEVLMQKEAIRILHNTEDGGPEPRERDLKRVRGGLLVQTPDLIEEERETMEVATKAQPDERTWRDLEFSWRVCKHVRSNAIVIAKDGATVGIGAGQMSRVDSVGIAIFKAREARGDDAAEFLSNSVVASDAFFPFSDGPQAAIDAGATAFIQPGGSKRDAEVVEACDEAGVAMVMTRRRHFRH